MKFGVWVWRVLVAAVVPVLVAGTAVPAEAGHGADGAASESFSVAVSDVHAELAGPTISLGDRHACGVHPEGDLTCWGFGFYGQATPVDGTFVDVAAGGTFTCAIAAATSLLCWGTDVFGAPDFWRDVPSGSGYDEITAGISFACVREGPDVTCWGADSYVDVPEAEFTSIDSGEHQSCGVTVTGEVLCWGAESSGHLVAPAGTFLSVSVGSEHSCAVRTDHSVTCWGSDSGTGRSVAPTGQFSSVAAGRMHTCAISEGSGQVVCWGDGFGSGAGPQVEVPAGEFVEIDAAGRSASTLVFNSYTCGVRIDSAVLCWGTDSPTYPPISQVKSVSAGATNPMCAIRSDSTLYCDLSPYAAPSGQFSAVAVGVDHGCGIDLDDNLVCFGRNTHGQATPPTGKFREVGVGGPANVVMGTPVAHSCAIRTSGTITCWGVGNWNETVPPTGQFRGLTVGPRHSCAVGVDDEAQCWGLNDSGSTEPPAGAFESLSAGHRHICGLRPTGTIECWGNDDYGQVSGAPSGSGFKDVAAGSTFTCGLRTGGEVECWGDGPYAALDDTPAGPFESIDAGTSVCGVLADTTLQCWGPRAALGRPFLPAAQITPPSSPTTVAVTAADAKIGVSWDVPADDGGTPDLTYTATASPGGHSCVTEALSCVISGVTNGATYTVKVTASNDAGTSAAVSAPAPVTPTRCGAPAGPGPFRDVGTSHQFCGSIEWMAASGVSGGYDDGTFRPTTAVSRQAMAAFLFRNDGEPPVAPSEAFFADVTSGQFFTAVQWMAESGLSHGTAQPTGKPLYKPGAPVSRQAMAAFLYRLAGEPAVGAVPVFDDVDTRHQFYAPVQWMAESGLSEGTPQPGRKPLYRPVEPVSRQAMAAFLHRANTGGA